MDKLNTFLQITNQTNSVDGSVRGAGRGYSTDRGEGF